ncbi:MAG: hypothetical protein AB7T37_06840 [Dehalococcoidia bacterium]
MANRSRCWQKAIYDETGAALPGYAIAAFAVLGIAVAGLALALGIALARDSDDSVTMRPGMNGYAGMMGALAMMDTDTMLQRMREVLGDDGYQAMLDHMQAHRNGTASEAVPGVDGMMHRLMDGMMSMMPPDANGHMFPNQQMPMQGMPRMTPGSGR